MEGIPAELLGGPLDGTQVGLVGPIRVAYEFPKPRKLTFLPSAMFEPRVTLKYKTRIAFSGKLVKTRSGRIILDYDGRIS